MNRKLLVTTLLTLTVSGAVLSGCGKTSSSGSAGSASGGSASVSSEEYTDTKGTDGILYELTEDQKGYVVTDCLTIESDIKIPELYNGLPVREIGDAAFRYFTMDSLSLPRSLRKIGNEAFLGLSYDSQITEIVIPEGVEEIGNKAFHYCPTIKEITLPTTLKKLGVDPFGLNQSLAKFHLEDSQYFKVQGNVLFNGDMTELICYPRGLKNTTYDVPDSVVSIAESAFYGNSYLTGITTGKNLKNVARRGMAAMFNLSNLNVGKSPLTILEDLAFSENSSLTSMILPSTVTSMGEGLFYKDTSLLTVSFENTFTELPDLFFSQCSKLMSIKLPANLTSIGERAFSSCNSLTSLQIPSTVTSIGKEAFSGALALKSIQLPAGMTAIEESLFANCRALQAISFPDNITSIGDRAFVGCTLIESIDLSSTKVASVGQSAFMGCDAVLSVKFPSTLRSIGEHAFEGLMLLKEVEFNDGLETIESQAFYGWKNLSKVYIPASVTSIGAVAFGSIIQGKVDLHLYFEADSFNGISAFASVAEENIFYSVTREAYEAL